MASCLTRPAVIFSVFLLCLGCVLCYAGLGPPNHPYQVAVGILVTALAYHRRWVRWPLPRWGWGLAPFNAFQLAMLSKLFIGSGRRQPFAWLKYPELGSRKVSGSWWSALPSWTLQWQSTPLASWEIDLTLVQMYLLLLTVLGALLRLQPFVSLTAMLLVIASVPAYTEFDWKWVFPAIAAATFAFYVQSKAAVIS